MNKIHNFFDFYLNDKKVGHAENIVLDQFYNSILLNFRENAYPMRNIQLGKGTAEPTITDTKLSSFVIQKGFASGKRYWDKELGCWVINGYIELASNECNNVSFTEVGMATTGLGIVENLLCTKALIKDENGKAISILKTESDKLRVYSTVYFYPINKSGYNYLEAFENAPNLLNAFRLPDFAIGGNGGAAPYLGMGILDCYTAFDGLSKVPIFFNTVGYGNASDKILYDCHMWKRGQYPGDGAGYITPYYSSYELPYSLNSNSIGGEFYLAENRLPNKKLRTLYPCLWALNYEPYGFGLEVISIPTVDVPIVNIGTGDGTKQVFDLPHADAKELKINLNGTVTNAYTINTIEEESVPIMPNATLNFWDTQVRNWDVSRRISGPIEYKEGYIYPYSWSPSTNTILCTYLHSKNGKPFTEFIELEKPKELTSIPLNGDTCISYMLSPDKSILITHVWTNSGIHKTLMYEYNYQGGTIGKLLIDIDGFCNFTSEMKWLIRATTYPSNPSNPYIHSYAYTRTNSGITLGDVKSSQYTYNGFCQVPYAYEAGANITNTILLVNDSSYNYKCTFNNETGIISSVSETNISKRRYTKDVIIDNVRIRLYGLETSAKDRTNNHVPCVILPKKQQITFANPPGTGVAITASYKLDYLPKDENWTMAYNYTVNFGRGADV